jgi:hypothetical protein
LLRRAWLRLLPDGERKLVAGVTRIGRGLEAEFRVESSRLGRLHTRVWALGGAYWVSDMASAYGTWLSRHGVMLGRIGSEDAQLESGDVIGIADRVEFTIDPAPPDETALALAAAVKAAPDDDGAWAAWADRLLELGDPLGARIAQQAQGWTCPGDLAGAYLQDAVTYEWRHGHVSCAKLPFPGLRQVGVAATLKVLLRAQVGAFMRALYLPMTHEEAMDHGVLEVLERERPVTLKDVWFSAR